MKSTILISFVFLLKLAICTLAATQRDNLCRGQTLVQQTVLSTDSRGNKLVRVMVQDPPNAQRIVSANKKEREDAEQVIGIWLRDGSCGSQYRTGGTTEVRCEKTRLDRQNEVIYPDARFNNRQIQLNGRSAPSTIGHVNCAQRLTLARGETDKTYIAQGLRHSLLPTVSATVWIYEETVPARGGLTCKYHT